MSCQAPLSVGFPRQGYWSGLPFPPPGYLPDSGIKPTSPTLVSKFFLPRVLISTGDGEQEHLPVLCTPCALLPTQRHLRQGRCASVLHQLPGQTPPSTRPQGLGVGARPLCGSCCVNPKVPASLISRWFWVPQSVLVSLSLSGTPTQAPGLVDFLSLSLSVIPLVRRPCASRKNLESN